MRRIALMVMASIGLAALPLAMLPSPAFAIAEPTSVSLDGIVVFKDMLVTDDFLAFVPYSIEFTIAPTETVDRTFIFRLLSSDNATEYGNVLATPAYDDGYGSGVVAFYFSENMTWEGAYTIRVQQNPTYYPAAQYWDFPLSVSNYSTATDQAAALKVKIVNSATYLTTTFGVALLAKSEAGSTVLSSYGELYYLTVVPGLQTMCPALFSVQLENPDYTKRTWITTFATTIQTKYAGTFIEDFMTGYAGLFSMEKYAASAFLSIFLFVVLIGVGVWKFKATILSGFLDGYALLLFLMLMGFFPMLAAGAVAFVLVVIGGVILFLNRA